MEDEKRELRKLKRLVKRAGNKSRRQRLKRDLAEHPEDAAFSEEEFGRHSSADIHVDDHDSTRGKKEEQS